MRTLTDHTTNEANCKIEINVLDEPGMGNASHHYRVVIGTNIGPKTVDLEFQNGPIKEVGVNGITQEVLLAILIDRLSGFQSGNFRCRENAIALTHLEEALMWLQKRTLGRVKRDVEGTHTV